MPTVIGRLTAGDDSIGGSSADEIFVVPSSNTNLSPNDTLAGGGGHDVLLFERTVALGVNFANLTGISGIEEFDVTASSSVIVTLDDATILQSGTDTLRLTFDGDPLALDMRAVTPGTGRVELWGLGPVTLYDAPRQEVFVGAFGGAGTVTGGTGRDTITGHNAGDTLTGGFGDDILSGGGGHDSLSGGDDQDRLDGGAGHDTLTGGAGYDLLTGGGGTNRVSGGSQSDTFVVTPGESLTITDFDPADRFERIDLRAFAGLGFSDLSIQPNGGNARIALPDGTVIVLLGVASAAITERNLIFAGDTVVTLAEGLSQQPVFEFTDAADRFTGTAGDDVFEVKGNFAKLNSDDVFDGGAGLDVLRIWGTDRALGESRVPGMTSIEIIDMTGADGALEMQVTQGMVDRSDTGTITVRHGANALTMLTGQVASADAVIVEGTGAVTLRDVPGQGVTISDHYGGTVSGQNKDDVILGGAMSDTISGSGGNDSLTSGAGDNRLDGGEGNDTLVSAGGSDTLTGGAGTDCYIVADTGAAQRLTITDFGGSAAFEFIDLRAFAGLRFADLAIAANGGNARITLPDGTQITLTGVAAASLSRQDFVLPGQDAPRLFTLSDGADVITGGSASDVIDFVGAISQLDRAVDSINGGAGLDVLRVFGSDRMLGDVRLDALSRIEVIDLTNATGSHDIAVDADNARSSDNGTITIRFGSSALALNTGGVTGPGQVVVEGSGPVTLSSGTPGQMLTIGDAMGGTVLTGNDATIVVGGAQGDSITADAGADTLSGNGGNDTLSGGDGDDQLSGGAAHDRLVGGAGNDRLQGDGGNDTLIGNEGFDLITGGAGSTLANGGAQSDTFVVTPGETLTIVDFDSADFYERIDLRAFAGLRFADLAIAANGGNARITLPDGTQITLSGVAAASLSEQDFLFAGNPLVLPAAGLSAPFDFQFTAGQDSFSGTAADEIFDLSGVLSNLSGREDTLRGGVDDGIFDRFSGGAGTDTLRIFGEDRSISPDRLAGMSGIEVIDLSGSTLNLQPAISITVDAAMVAQSGSGTITIRHGANALFLDTELAPAGTVITEGTGLITLRNVPGQTPTVSDLVPGNILDGNDPNLLTGGAQNDTLDGFERNDTILGNGGDDLLIGGDGDDRLDGGAGNDTLLGGEGNDILRGGAGANRLDGDGGFDQYIIEAGAQGTVIADYDPMNFVERIDLTALAGLGGLRDLTFTNEGPHVRVTGRELDLLLENVQAAELDGADFLFAGQDPRVYNVRPGTTTAQLQQLFDGAVPDAIINIAAGTYSITQTLHITRSDISVIGAGEGQTIFRTDIAPADAGPTILVHPEDLQIRYGTLATDLAEGATTVQLPDVEALRLADPDLEIEQFEVGDLIFFFQANDDAYLRSTGDLGNADGIDWREPEPDPANPVSAELYYLREFRSRIVSIDANGVATLAEASPYSFAGGTAQVSKSTFLENVHLSDFSVVGNFEDDAGGAPDPFLFENTMPEWVSIAAVEFDGVRDSSMARITVTDPAAHAFRWQRAHETTADRLTALGAHNKDGSSGYHFLLQESFANDFTNLSSTDARHAVLFSSYNAEHYNSLHLTFANRDINFHGSMDSDNTIVVDRLVQDYPADGSTDQWRAVQPGVRGLHPNTEISDNDVTFRFARTSDRSEIVVAHVDGGNIALGDGSDEGIGNIGRDTINGDTGNDTLRGNGNDDTLNGGDGQDFLFGGNGNDVLRGAEGNDRLFGGSGDDVINGGPNGDDLTGGPGRDTFLRSYADFTDNYLDFEAGAGGDIMRVRGSAYTRFSELRLAQVGTDVVLDFGPTGATTFKNTLLADLVEANFAFDDDGGPGQDIRLRATEMWAVGTHRGDTFAVSRAHMDDPTFGILAGGGYDVVSIAQSSLNANLGTTGSYSGVEEFDLSAIATLGLVVENPLVSQSSSGKLYLRIGDTGTPVLLDVGPLGRGKNVFIDGARTVQLTGGREHTVKSDDDTGTNIVGDVLRDIIYGGRANDSILGGDGNDVLFGSAGDDTLRGEAGNDTINGGPGSDTIYIEDAGDRVAESNRWAGTDTVVASVDFRMGRAHIENLELTGTAILGAGNGLQNVITGNAQDNILDGGKNNDTLIGGLGNDTYLLRAPGDTAVEQAGGGIDTVRAFGSFALGANIENLFLQRMVTSAGTPVQNLNAIGNELDNAIIGNPFDNTIVGREGRDTLRGQAGADSFVFDRPLGPDNVDRIIDFNVNEANEGDRLLMRQSVFPGVVRGVLDPASFATGTAAADADDRFIFDQASGRLWFDVDGTGATAQQLVATFEQNALVTAADIEIF